MAAQPYTVLRGPDALQSRQAEATGRAFGPTTRALAGTPVMGAPPPAWVPLPLSSGYVAAPAPLAAPAAHIDALGYVHTQGAVVAPGGGLGAGVAVLTLPIGYRPRTQLQFPVAGGGGFQSVAVIPSGPVVLLQAIGGGGALVLGFSFLAEQ